MDRCAKYALCLSIILTLVFIAGCVEKQFLPSEKEEIDRAWDVDTNGDGIFEQHFALFKPKQIGNITVKREVVAEKKVGYFVTTTLRIFSNKSESTTNIELREIIPYALSTDLDKINFDTNYDSVVKKDPPFVVSWKFTFSGEEERETTVSYSTTVYREIDRDWFSNYVSPYIDIEIINPKANPVVFAFSEFSDNYLKALTGSVPNYYAAVAIYISTFLCIIFVSYEVLTVFAAFLSSMVSRGKFRDVVYKFIGHGRKNSTMWIIIGVVLIVFGLVLCVTPGEAKGSTGMELAERITSNPVMALGIFSIVLGVIALYTVIMDLVKGALFGEKYFFEPIDMVKAKIGEGRNLTVVMQDKIEECESCGISTETELLFLTTQKRKIEEIENNIDIENAEEYVPIISRIITDMGSELTGIEEKKELYRNWPIWKEAIDKTLITKDTVAPEDLLSVPEGWRKWSLTRYLSEHLGEALTIENGMLSRMRIATVRKGEIDLVLNEFLGAGKIDGVALVRKDGLVIAANLPKGIDPNIIAAISAKVIANADISSLELEKGKTRMIILKSTNGETVIYGGKKIVLVALIKPGEATGFIVSGIEKVMEKMEPLF